MSLERLSTRTRQLEATLTNIKLMNKKRFKTQVILANQCLLRLIYKRWTSLPSTESQKQPDVLTTQEQALLADYLAYGLSLNEVREAQERTRASRIEAQNERK